MNTTTDRDTVLDFLRIIALLMVVVVHTHIGNLSIDSTSEIVKTLVFFLGKLGVPIFIMISGSLLLPRNEEVVTFYKKRVQKILVPWITWSALLVLFKVYSSTIVVTSAHDFFKEFVIVMLSDFWFMPMIIGVYILTPYIRVFISSKVPLQYLLLSWVCIASLLPFFYLSPLFPGSTSSGVLAMSINFCGYFLLGWYLKKYWLKKNSFQLLTAIFASSSLLYLFGIYIFYENENKLFFVIHDYFSPALLVGSIVFFIAVNKAYYLFSKFISKKILESLSIISYGIFLSHVLITMLLSIALSELFQQDHSLLGWLIRIILVYSSSAILVAAIASFPFLKKYVT